MFTIFAAFNVIEQYIQNEQKNMILIEYEILNQALGALREKFALSEDMVFRKENAESGLFDAVVRIMNIDFLCEIKNNITTTSFNTVLNRLKTKADSRPVLLVARYISPTLLNELAVNSINALDCAGNCYIRYMEEGSLVFQLSNKGEKNIFMKERSYPAFQDSGIKVIFYFLNDPVNVNKPYRDIKEATGVSLGTIKNVMDELIASHYILVTEKGRFLKNRKGLLEQWVINYNQVLKPKLLLGKMSFRSNEHRMKWFAMELLEGMYWGGESGAQMVDGYLEPGSFDIYTDIPTANLMKTGFVRQDENGEISVYQKFWNWRTENRLVPLVLIYADLMGSGNSRCLEIAQRLLENGLKDFK